MYSNHMISLVSPELGFKYPTIEERGCIGARADTGIYYLRKRTQI